MDECDAECECVLCLDCLWLWGLVQWRNSAAAPAPSKARPRPGRGQMHGVGGHAGNHVEIPARTSSAPPADTAASFTHKRMYLPVKTGSAIVRGGRCWPHATLVCLVLLLWWCCSSSALIRAAVVRRRFAHGRMCFVRTREQMAMRHHRPPPRTACNTIPVSHRPVR